MTENLQLDYPKWTCHLHSNSKSSCSMVYEFVLNENKADIINNHGNYFHVIEVKIVDKSVSFLNEKNVPNEFWENLGPTCFVTPIAYSNWINYESVINKIFDIFKKLDEERFYYSEYNTPNDFVKKHLIVDSVGQINLCNKHLMKQNKHFKSRYNTNSWFKRIIKALYPNIVNKKNKISTDIPLWVTLKFNETNSKNLQTF